MSNYSISNLYACIDRDTNIVIWAKPNWNGYPNLKESDVNIVFINHKNYKNFNVKVEDFESFNVTYSIDHTVTNNYEIKKVYVFSKHDLQITDEQRDKFKLIRIKCSGIYNWLSNINNYMNRFNGVLPDIYVTHNESENKLAKEQFLKVKKIVSETINTYYDQLWSCETEEKFITCLTNAAKSVSFH